MVNRANALYWFQCIAIEAIFLVIRTKVQIVVVGVFFLVQITKQRIPKSPLFYSYLLHFIFAVVKFAVCVL